MLVVVARTSSRKYFSFSKIKYILYLFFIFDPFLFDFLEYLYLTLILNISTLMFKYTRNRFYLPFGCSICISLTLSSEILILTNLLYLYLSISESSLTVSFTVNCVLG